MRTLILTLLTAATPLLGAECPMVDVNALVLYWRPIDCAQPLSLDAIQVGNESTPVIAEIKDGYDWGFRLAATWQSACLIAQARYSWLQTGTNREYNTPSVDEAVRIFGAESSNARRARGFVRYAYQSADLRLGKNLFNGCAADLIVFVNGRWAYIERSNLNRMDTLEFGLPGVASWRQRTHFEGGGVGVGASSSYCLFGRISFHSDLNLTLMSGERHLTFSRSIEDPVFTRTLKYPRDTNLVPVMDYRISFTCACQYSCLALEIEAGFEGCYYWRALPYERPNRGRAPTGIALCRNVGFAGPFAGARLIF